MPVKLTLADHVYPNTGTCLCAVTFVLLYARRTGSHTLSRVSDD